MLVLHLWRQWSATILLSALHLFRMQRRAHIWPSENEQAPHRIRTVVRNAVLQLVQRLHLPSRMPNDSWSALKKWGNVRFPIFFSAKFVFSVATFSLIWRYIFALPEVWIKVCRGGHGHRTMSISICCWLIRSVGTRVENRPSVCEVWWTWAQHVSWIALFK